MDDCRCAYCKTKYESRGPRHECIPALASRVNAVEGLMHEVLRRLGQIEAPVKAMIGVVKDTQRHDWDEEEPLGAPYHS